MLFSLDDPIIQSSVLPLALALALTGLLRLLFGATVGARTANLSVGLSFAILVCLIQGVAFPPVGSTQKIPYLVGALVLLAGLADFVALRNRILLPLMVLIAAACLWWLNQTRWAGADSLLLTQVALVFGAGLIVLVRLLQLRPQQLTPVIMLVFACAGFGAISLMGSSALLTTLAFALMAALGGFALWNWPKHRYPAGAGVICAGGGSLLLMTNQALLLTDTSAVALALLLPLFWVDRLAEPVCRRWQLGAVARPLVVAACSLAVVLIAVAVSFSINPIGADSGY